MKYKMCLLYCHTCLAGEIAFLISCHFRNLDSLVSDPCCSISVRSIAL